MKSQKRAGLPFSVARDGNRTLVAQVEEGVRAGILSGRYKPGEMLPSTSELAAALGISRIVTRMAYRRLESEGLIVPQVGIGCVVRGAEEALYRGHVLAVLPLGDDNFFQHMMLGALRRRLSDAHYLLTQVVVAKDAAGKPDYRQLEIALAQGVDFVCSFHNEAWLQKGLAARGLCYAALLGAHPKAPGAVGSVWLDYERALPDLVSACRARGVRRIVQVSWTDTQLDAVPALKAAGFAAKDVRLAVDLSEGRIGGTRKAGLDAFLGRLGKKPLPDLLLFQDDHLADGALTALLSRGVRIPEDVSVVTWANRRDLPVFPKELARMEVDPVSAGEASADAVIRYLETGDFPKGVSFGPKWIAGATLQKISQSKQGTIRKEKP